MAHTLYSHLIFSSLISSSLIVSHHLSSSQQPFCFAFFSFPLMSLLLLSLFLSSTPHLVSSSLPPLIAIFHMSVLPLSFPAMPSLHILNVALTHLHLHNEVVSFYLLYILYHRLHLACTRRISPVCQDNIIIYVVVH